MGHLADLHHAGPSLQAQPCRTAVGQLPSLSGSTGASGPLFQAGGDTVPLGAVDSAALVCHALPELWPILIEYPLLDNAQIARGMAIDHSSDSGNSLRDSDGSHIQK